MKTDKLRELDTLELESKAREMQEQMFRSRFQLGMGQTEVVRRLRETRKDRARVLTILSERVKREGK